MLKVVHLFSFQGQIRNKQNSESLSENTGHGHKPALNTAPTSVNVNR